MCMTRKQHRLADEILEHMNAEKLGIATLADMFGVSREVLKAWLDKTYTHTGIMMNAERLLDGRFHQQQIGQPIPEQPPSLLAQLNTMKTAWERFYQANPSLSQAGIPMEAFIRNPSKYCQVRRVATRQ